VSSAAATKLVASAISSTEKIDSSTPSPSASSGATAAGRQRPVGGARHQGVEVALVPHVDGAGGARAQRDRQHREEASNGWIWTGAITRRPGR
jgi:hypothetical protein